MTRIYFERDSENRAVISGLPHQIAASESASDDRGTWPLFDFSNDGEGARETAANLLHLRGVSLQDCRRFASRLATDIIRMIPHEGGELSMTEIDDWIAENHIASHNER